MARAREIYSNWTSCTCKFPIDQNFSPYQWIHHLHHWDVFTPFSPRRGGIWGANYDPQWIIFPLFNDSDVKVFCLVFFSYFQSLLRDSQLSEDMTKSPLKRCFFSPIFWQVFDSIGSALAPLFIHSWIWRISHCVPGSRAPKKEDNSS